MIVIITLCWAKVLTVVNWWESSAMCYYDYNIPLKQDLPLLFFVSVKFQDLYTSTMKLQIVDCNDMDTLPVLNAVCLN